MVNCKICMAKSSELFKDKILGKYLATYFKCDECGFVHTEEPYWLSEAYSEAINTIDIGQVNRATSGARIVENVILADFDASAKFLDYGAGYGVFVRLMRDRGYDFRWLDTYCQNIFAKQFVHTPTDNYEMVTAFEVFEHLVDPLSEIEKILVLGKNIMFSTLLVPPGARGQQDWPYFGVDHGQHIAFYTPKSLQIIAKHFGMHVVTDGREMHLLSREPVTKKSFLRSVQDNRIAAVIRKLNRRRAGVHSLLQKDFSAVSGYDLV